jgi:hypothetical protein
LIFRILPLPRGHLSPSRLWESRKEPGNLCGLASRSIAVSSTRRTYEEDAWR